MPALPQALLFANDGWRAHCLTRRMAYKQLRFSSEAREKILRGANVLADAVRVTLGPKSKSVLIDKRWGTPIVCNDGATIAKEIDLSVLRLTEATLTEMPEPSKTDVGPLPPNYGG